MFDLESLTETKAAIRKLVAALSYHSGFVTVLQNSAVPPWRILMYHRVIRPEQSILPLQPGMYVRPETFAKQIEYLVSTCRVLPLDALALEISERKPIPPRTIAITFDDGWRDTFDTAFPILQEHRVSATVFLATGYINTENLFWSDTVGLLLKELAEHRTSWTIPPLKAAASFEERHFRNQLLRIQRGSSTQEFEQALEGMIHLIKSSAPERRESLLARLHTLAAPFGQRNPGRVFLNWEEVHVMAESGISFGSHTHRHTFLSELNRDELREDVECSLGCLKSQLAQVSPIFCYPGGEYSEQSQTGLYELGIRAALTTKRSSDLAATPMLLGRVGIHEDVSHSLPLFTFRVWG